MVKNQKGLEVKETNQLLVRKFKFIKQNLKDHKKLQRNFLRNLNFGHTVYNSI